MAAEIETTASGCWQIEQKMETKLHRSYLFGSRARGDWDGLSDTDLLVVSDTKAEADECTTGCSILELPKMSLALIVMPGRNFRTTHR